MQVAHIIVMRMQRVKWPATVPTSLTNGGGGGVELLVWWAQWTAGVRSALKWPIHMQAMSVNWPVFPNLELAQL